MDRTRSELTAFHRIYRKTYWGWGSATGTKSLHHPSIIENRNRFADDYCLKKVITNRLPRKVAKFIETARRNLRVDHVEAYKTEAGQTIVLSSPYCLSEDDEMKYIQAGWIKLPQLYCTSATTMMHLNPV